MSRAKHNISYDLMKILRSFPKRDLLPVIVDLVNGDYNFGRSYLGTVSHEEIALNLEKILVLGTHRYYRKPMKPYYRYQQDLFLAYAKRFIEVIDQVKFRDLRQRNKTARNYNFLIRKAKLKEYCTHPGKLPLSIKVAIIFIGLISIIKIATAGADLLSADSNIQIPINPPAAVSDTYNPTVSVGRELRISSPQREITLPLEEYESFAPDVPVTGVEESIEKTDEQKIADILVEYGLTYEEFRVTAAIACAEAKWSYKDAYWVINAMDNRCQSKKWSTEFGTSIYKQAIAKNTQGQFQFAAYADGRYREFLDAIDTPMYQAVIDFLTTREVVHQYLQFRSWEWDFNGRFNEPSEPGGNRYFQSLKPEDRLEISTNKGLN